MQKCLSHRDEFYIELFIEFKDININEYVTYHDMLHFNRTMYLEHLHWKAKRGNANVKEVLVLQIALGAGGLYEACQRSGAITRSFAQEASQVRA